MFYYGIYTGVFLWIRLSIKSEGISVDNSKGKYTTHYGHTEKLFFTVDFDNDGIQDMKIFSNIQLLMDVYIKCIFP